MSVERRAALNVLRVLGYVIEESYDKTRPVAKSCAIVDIDAPALQIRCCAPRTFPGMIRAAEPSDRCVAARSPPNGAGESGGARVAVK